METMDTPRSRTIRAPMPRGRIGVMRPPIPYDNEQQDEHGIRYAKRDVGIIEQQKRNHARNGRGRHQDKDDESRYKIPPVQPYPGGCGMEAEVQDRLIETGAILRRDSERLVFQPELLLDCGQGLRLAACNSEPAEETRTLAPIEHAAEYEQDGIDDPPCDVAPDCRRDQLMRIELHPVPRGSRRQR